MDTIGQDTWATFCASAERLEQNIALSDVAVIDSGELRDSAKQTAQVFFRQCALELVRLEGLKPQSHCK